MTRLATLHDDLDGRWPPRGEQRSTTPLAASPAARWRRTSLIVSTGPSKRTRGSNPRTSRSSDDDAQDLAPHSIAEPVRLQAEDDRSDLADRVVEVVDHTRQSTRLIRLGGPRPHALDRHSRREQLLDDDVVQVTGDPFPVLHHPKVLFCLAQPFLRLESLPNIADDLDVAPRTTLVARDRLQDHLDRHVGAVAVAMHGDERGRRDIAPRRGARAGL